MSRLPETEQSLLRHLRYEKRQRLRNENASPYSRSGMSLIAEGIASVDGQIQSHDFDGTDRAHLGTTGWLLGWADNQPSMLVLNGVDVYADLAAKDVTILGLIDSLELTQADLIATVDALANTQADLAAQQAYLASLVTKDATASGFNTGTLAADSTIHYVGTPGTLSIACPTGKLRIIASCPEASIDTGTGAGGVIAYLSFAISGQVAMGAYTSRLYSAGTRIGATLTRVKTLTVPPGTYTVSVQAGYWCAGFTAASIDFADMDLSAEVVNAS